MVKFKIIIEELELGDISDLVCTATYGNYDCLYVTLGKDAVHDKDVMNESCFEDRIAYALLHGYEVEVRDEAGAENNEEDVEFYGTEGETYVSKYIKKEDGYYTPCYLINLDTLTRGLNNENYSHLLKEFFIDQSGDLFTAWNLMQVAVFGDIIYG